MGAVVGHRPDHVALMAQTPQRARNAFAAGQADEPCVRRGFAGLRLPAGLRAGVACRLRVAGRILDDDLLRRVVLWFARASQGGG